jgi:hypothetical protein
MGGRSEFRRTGGETEGQQAHQEGFNLLFHGTHFQMQRDV